MGAKQTGTQTTTSAPPRYAMPYIQQGMGGAAALLGNQQRNPFSADTLSAQDMIRQRAAGGNPLLGQAQGAVSGVLGAGPNPQLDAMFNQAADRSQSRFASEFAGAGRDVSASQPFRGMELGDLATQIYGGAYENDQNRRLSAAGMAPGLANADYFDASQLAGVGQQIEQRPGENLDAYMQRIMTGAGNYGSQSQPTYSNPLASLAGLAMGAGSLGWAPFGAAAASDRRIKRDIEPIGVRNGFPLYRFKYLWDDIVREGHMSDEVPASAVIRGVLGFDLVDYGAL